MNPGKLDRLAQLFALSEDTGPSGAPRRVFASPVIIYVAPERERFAGRLPVDQSGARREVTEARFVARYSAAITAGSRLVVDGVTYDILAAIEKDGSRRAYLVLTCRAVKGAQPVAPS